GADEGLYVQDVPEARILGARARPKETLHPSATSGQGLPARAAGELLPILIGELRVGDGHLADEAAQLGLVRAGARLQNRIDENVQTTDEHAGNAGHAGQIPTTRGERFEAVHVRLHHLSTRGAREEERDVDVDSLADELSDRRDPLGRRRNLDHEVLAMDRAPEARRLVDGRLGVMREVRRDLHADVPVAAIGLVVDRTEDVSRLLNVLDGEPFVDRRRGLALVLFVTFQRGPVVRAAGDRLFEDRRVRRDAADAVLPHQSRELAALKEMAPDVVEPDRLAVPRMKLLQIHERLLLPSSR